MKKLFMLAAAAMMLAGAALSCKSGNQNAAPAAAAAEAEDAEVTFDEDDLEVTEDPIAAKTREYLILFNKAEATGDEALSEKLNAEFTAWTESLSEEEQAIVLEVIFESLDFGDLEQTLDAELDSLDFTEEDLNWE